MFKLVQLAALLLSLVVLPVHASDNVMDPVPKPPAKLVVGGVQWKLGFDSHTADMHISEYVSNNETVNNWKQLLTFQRFLLPPDKIASLTPKSVAILEMTALKDTYRHAIFNILSANDQESIVEFHVVLPVNAQQHELQRIIKTATGLVFIHYVIRKEDMGNDARTQWIYVLRHTNLPFTD